MKKRSLLILTLVAMMLFTLGQTVWAFKDVKNDANEKQIEELQKLGILSGDKHDKFNPKGTLTYAQGVSMIVKGLELNIDHIRFIKAPEASDYFTNLKDDAWYSDAFIIANLNGLEIPKTVKANDIMTREQFAHHLFKAILTKGDYAFIEIFMLLEDEADVNKDYMDSIQKLIISKIVTLDKSNKFYPKKAITRSEAAGWLYGAIQFVKETTPIPELPEQPVLDPKLSVTAVNAEINKVTVTAQVPHPGYGIRIASIGFEGDKAVIYLETVLPDPDKMYPQVITDVSVSTYVDAKLKPVLPESAGSSQSSTGSAIIAE
ncbi:S-layer homology domain-containing protein [Paenibacillus sp. LHD-38]|uniref:S-layer homology domain-containing protein n=1 Tax=Paenibacillus sp. LHD-38 TaxID=3072143 RepID=UPI00280CDCC5|nr:S-layer homology domain-containing protein [Paenibacillus sp. LHD-38]MDQ8733536.1 S-layer homology domain-containing protein [Paenibacillus sp. LHD-38]